MLVPNWLICGAAINFGASAFGQASFELANKHTPVVDAPGYDAAGVPLDGANYRAELWGAATPDSLTPLVVIDEGFRREIISFRVNGYFASAESMLCVVDVNPGGFAWLQVRAWDARLGTTWEDVAALGVGGYGESSLFYGKGADPFSEPPQLPGPLIGLQSLSLRPIPEPSTWAMLAFGLGSMWLFVRRKRR